MVSINKCNFLNCSCFLRKSAALSAIRLLHLIEYQTKRILAENECTVPEFCVLEMGKQFSDMDKLSDGNGYVVKAQVAGGDRGRGIFTSGFRGGVHQTRKKSEALEIAHRMLGQTIVTNNTGASGVIVDKVLIATSVHLLQSRYLSIRLNPAADGPTVEIKSDNQKGHVFHLPLTDRLPADTLGAMVAYLNFGPEFEGKVAGECEKIWNVFVKFKAISLEINPLILAQRGDIMCLDANIVLDDYGPTLGEQKAIALPEVNYVHLGGDIGCLVNGAGLAMATNDLITGFGAKPGTFVHLRTNNLADMKNSLQHLASHTKLNAILVNIAWSFMDCCEMAKAILSAEIKLPMVVRLKGTNETAAYELLHCPKGKIYANGNMNKVCRKVVTYARLYSQRMTK